MKQALLSALLAISLVGALPVASADETENPCEGGAEGTYWVTDGADVRGDPAVYVCYGENTVAYQAVPLYAQDARVCFVVDNEGTPHTWRIGVGFGYTGDNIFCNDELQQFFLWVPYVPNGLGAGIICIAPPQHNDDEGYNQFRFGAGITTGIDNVCDEGDEIYWTPWFNDQHGIEEQEPAIGDIYAKFHIAESTLNTDGPDVHVHVDAKDTVHVEADLYQRTENGWEAYTGSASLYIQRDCGFLRTQIPLACEDDNVDQPFLAKGLAMNFAGGRHSATVAIADADADYFFQGIAASNVWVNAAGVNHHYNVAADQIFDEEAFNQDPTGVYLGSVNAFADLSFTPVVFTENILPF